MKKWEKVNKNAKINKKQLFNNTLINPMLLNKIENTYNINTFCSNKNSIILFQKQTDKKITPVKSKNKNNINIKVYNYSHSKSNEEKSKTLNNNKKILSTKSKNIINSKFKIIEQRIYSPLNKSLNKIDKKKFSIEKRNKTPIIKNKNN